MKLIRCCLLLMVLLLGSFPASSQASEEDWTWWVLMHGWDGYSPWRYYLTMSPGYTGPNALPVPETPAARIPEHPFIRVSGFAHLSKGDQTINPYVRAGVPLGKRVLFEVWYVPVEFYQMDTNTVFVRASLNPSGKGSAMGDVYVSTGIQVTRAEGWKPDIHIRSVLKTASGEKLTEARHTDAPGYYFDLTSAWNITTRGDIELRPFFSGGFYSWQVYHPARFQNDAFLFSTGLACSYGKHSVRPYVAGYYGWIDNGDRPLAFRLDYEYQTGSGALMFQYQFGIHDLYFDTYGIGYKHSFKNINFKD